jgi:hypothetical protein
MWRTIELREIRIFLTLAEELHFGRTAEQLNLGCREPVAGQVEPGQ